MKCGEMNNGRARELRARKRRKMEYIGCSKEAQLYAGVSAKV